MDRASRPLAVDVADWLRRMDLEQHAPAFRDNAIDAAVLPSLTAEDLKDLGLRVPAKESLAPRSPENITEDRS